MPKGYFLEWSGQYENLIERRTDLENDYAHCSCNYISLHVFCIPLHAGSVFNLISIPFAPIGGVFMISIWEVNLSVAVAVGFIALFGLAVETGIVMVIYLNDAMQQLVSIKGNSREAYQQRRSERICNQWSGKTSAPKNNDGMRYTFRLWFPYYGAPVWEAI